MIYLITRTSAYNYCGETVNRPCEEAFEKLCRRFQIRTCIDEEEFNTKYSYDEGLWKSKGKNHKIVAEGIQRELEPVLRWCINIKTIGQLNKFINKYGEIIISQDDNMKKIEIYDTYRE